MTVERTLPDESAADTIEVHHSGLERLECALCYDGLVYVGTWSWTRTPVTRLRSWSPCRAVGATHSEGSAGVLAGRDPGILRGASAFKVLRRISVLRVHFRSMRTRPRIP